MSAVYCKLLQHSCTVGVFDVAGSAFWPMTSCVMSAHAKSLSFTRKKIVAAGGESGGKTHVFVCQCLASVISAGSRWNQDGKISDLQSWWAPCRCQIGDRCDGAGISKKWFDDTFLYTGPCNILNQTMHNAAVMSPCLWSQQYLRNMLHCMLT